MVDHAVKFHSAREALFALLHDLGWHSYKELSAVAGLRYGARLLELKRMGYVIDSSELETGKIYRLVSLERGQQQAKQVKVFLSEEEALSIWYGVPSQASRCKVRDALKSFTVNREKL